MRSTKVEVALYQLESKTGRQEIKVNAGAQIKYTQWWDLIVLQRPGAKKVTRVFWIFRLNETVDQSVVDRLEYVGIWRDRVRTMTIWEEPEPSRAKPTADRGGIAVCDGDWKDK